MKLKKYFKKKNYLMQLLFTIAGFCCIPLIIMQLIMMEQSAKGYSRMNEENIYENLAGSTEWFLRQVEDMSTVAMKISQDTIIRKAAKEDCSPYGIYEAHNRIDEYSNDQYSVGVWFDANDNVLFHQVNITPKRLYEILGGANQGSRDAMKAFFEEKEFTRITSTAEYEEGKNSVIVVAKPVSFLSVIEKDAQVFFVMEQTVVEKEFLARFHDCSGVALLDAEGKFLVRGKDFSMELCEEPDFQKFMAEEGQRTYITSNGEENICIYKYRDIAKGYTCLVSIYEDSMEAYLREWVNDIRTILITSIVIILMLLSLTVYINYRPLKRLVRKHAGKAASVELSELELLDSAFLAADEKIFGQKQMLTHFLVGDLLRGRPVDEKLLEESGLNANTHGCMVIALNGPAIQSAQSDQISAIMKAKYGCDSYITGITYQPQPLMICVLHEEIAVEELQEQVSAVLKEVTGYVYSTYCGTHVEKITDIRASYLRSLASASENEAEKTEFDSYVAEAIRMFGESLETGDVAVIRKSLETVELRLSAMAESDAYETYYCYKLMTVYFTKAKELRNFKKEVARLIAFPDTKQLFVMLHQSVERFCVQCVKDEQVTAHRLRKELLDYIEANFNNKNLSLTVVADYLKTSVYVATRLFKETTGKNFKEYVMEKRMEYARELLKTTAQKVAEISAMAGFEDSEYFSSLFKTKYGQTPTQYRKSCRNNENS